MSPLLLAVESTKEEILKLFFNIPEDQVQKLLNNCDVFLMNFSLNREAEEEGLENFEEDEMIDEQDLLAGDSENNNSEKNEGLNKLKKRRRKRLSNKKRKQLYITLIIVLISTVFGIYFGMSFYMTEELVNNTNAQIPEYNITCFAEPFSTFTYNIIGYSLLIFFKKLLIIFMYEK